MTINVAEREKGQFPISIGTSLALEGALGVYPERPEMPPPLNRYKEVWFNMYTLFRNLMASMKSEQQRGVTAMELVPALLEDVLGIVAVLEAQTKYHVSPVFYLNDYSGLSKRYPHAKLKEPTTDNQLIFAALEGAVLGRFLADKPPVPIRREHLVITQKHPAALIVTHYPMDLFARYQFDRLDLLESHTGKIKTPSQWNSKLSGNPEATAMIPFMPFTLQVFGDGIQFVHQLSAVKHAVIDTAKATHWSSVTTLEKVKVTLRTHVKDEDVLATLERFY